MIKAKSGIYELHNQPFTYMGITRDGLSLFDTEKRVYVPFFGKIKVRQDNFETFNTDLREKYTKKDYQEMLNEQIKIYERKRNT